MPVWKLYSRQSSISEASTCQRDLLLLSERYAACALHGNVSAVRLCGVCAVSIEAFVVIGGGILLFFEAEFDPYCIAKPKRLGFALPYVLILCLTIWNWSSSAYIALSSSRTNRLFGSWHGTANFFYRESSIHSETPKCTRWFHFCHHYFAITV